MLSRPEGARCKKALAESAISHILAGMDALLSPAEIKRLAAERGMTLAAVCKKADIATSTFSRWQAGKTEPTLTVYRRLVAVVRGEAA